MTKAFMSRRYHTLQPLQFYQDPSKTHASINVSFNNAYMGRSQPVHMSTLHSYMPYQGQKYGYHVAPIVKETTLLRVSAVIVNNHQHRYHSSGTDNTCIYQFCLTSHSIMSMGHARLIKILYIYCKLYFLAVIRQMWSFLEPMQGVFNSKASCRSPSLYTHDTEKKI